MANDPISSEAQAGAAQRLTYTETESLVDFLCDELSAFGDDPAEGVYAGEKPTRDQAMLAILKWAEVK